MTDSFNAAEYHRQLDLDEEEKKARIEERLQHIKLSNRGLTFVPQFVMQVQNIRSIDLGYNKLTVMPSDLTIHCEKTLKSLVIWNNFLVSLPPEIVRCTNLTELKLGNNHLPNLPENLGRLTTLNKLDVSGNRIAALPSTLSHLVDLTLLNISRNSLQVPLSTALPNVSVIAIAAERLYPDSQSRHPLRLLLLMKRMQIPRLP